MSILIFCHWEDQFLLSLKTIIKAIISMPAKGKISVAPMKKNPIPKVRQSKPKNPKKIIFSFTRTIITRTQLILSILIGIQMSQHFLSFGKTLAIRIHLGLQRLTLRTSTRYFCMIPQINHYLATVEDSLVPVA